MLALYQIVIEHHNALKSLRREHEKLKANEKVLADILTSLRSGYNPNYQDMAVLEAVRGWEHYAKIPHIGEEEKAKERKVGDEEDTEAEGSDEEPEEVLEEGEWSSSRLEYDLNSLINTDHVNLLLEHDKHIGHDGSAAPASIRMLFMAFLTSSLTSGSSI